MKVFPASFATTLGRNTKSGQSVIKDGLAKKWGMLRLMAEEKFEVFVTVDRNLPYQQNLQRLPVAIFVLCAFNNRRETLKMLIPKIFEQISMGATADLYEIS